MPKRKIERSSSEEEHCQDIKRKKHAAYKRKYRETINRSMSPTILRNDSNVSYPSSNVIEGISLKSKQDLQKRVMQRSSEKEKDEIIKRQRKNTYQKNYRKRKNESNKILSNESLQSHDSICKKTNLDVSLPSTSTTLSTECEISTTNSFSNILISQKKSVKS